MRWGMVELYLWRTTTATAGQTASAVHAAATSDSVQSLLFNSGSSPSNWCLISPLYQCLIRPNGWLCSAITWTPK
uniref:Uncharacterized protein n=1 Tax=Picea sitchensis TaxID=3332 RepID=A9NKJ6_PICSI|nr:unknown [Picea sitchensis]ABK22184.1 unknown [Picea sitchensis]